MNDQLVEQIVRDVMSRFNGTGGLRGDADGTSTPRTVPATDRCTREELRLLDLVVTGKLLEQQLNGHRRLMVGPRTVLTPSAQDVLKARGITWSRGSSTDDASQPPRTAEARWIAVVSRTTDPVERVLAELCGGDAWSRELAGQPAEAAELAAGLLCRGDAAGVVVLSATPELAACLANRSRSVRAAVVDDVNSVRAAMAALAANLICLDPERKNWFELRQILKTYHNGGVPQPPPNWNEP